MTSTTAAFTATRTTRSNASTVPAAHLDLVRKVAKKIARRLPSVVDVDDLVGAGTIGLMDAAARYDAARCDNFGAYAEIRIRGAILDHLRAMDWLPRSERRRARTAAADAAAHGQAAAAPVAAVVSVEDVRSDGFEGFEASDDVAAPLAQRERKQRLAAAIAQLSPRVQQILSLYYVEELTLKQIGAMFDVTESRACQLHHQALKQLKRELGDDLDLA